MYMHTIIVELPLLLRKIRTFDTVLLKITEIVTLAIGAQFAFTFQPTLLSNVWKLKHFLGKES